LYPCTLRTRLGFDETDAVSNPMPARPAAQISPTVCVPDSGTEADRNYPSVKIWVEHHVAVLGMIVLKPIPQSEFNRGGRVCDLASHEGFAARWAFMIE
jgi:hypothetical protein